MTTRRISFVPLAIAVSLFSTGCYTDADGRQPDPNRLYFPTGLVASPGRTTLYVANSDFDLGFSGGSLQVMDLRRMREDTRVIVDTIAEGGDTSAACRAAGRGDNPDPWLNPGPCDAFRAEPYIENVAFIGAFASGLLLLNEPDGDAARLFVPVRGEPSITYFDVEDDRGADAAFSPSFALACEKSGDGFCGDAHRLGRDPDRTLRGLQLPADPVGIAATADGEAIVTAHQTQGSASLVINDWDARPELAFFLSGLSAGPTEIAGVPQPAFTRLAEEAADAGGYSFTYRPGFAVTFRSSPELDLLRFVPDAGAVPPRPFIVRDEAIAITTNASAFDSRGIALVASEREACEAACPSQADALACTVACAEDIPIKLYMANRNPASLLVGRLETIVNRSVVDGEEVITSASETAFFYDSVPLNFGPSRLEVGHVVNQAGQLEERVFAVCFDSRTVFVFHPFAQRTEAVIRTGRGPHDVAFDTGIDEDGEAYAFLHVGHFTDSYIGIVDLDMRHALTFAQIFANVGQPTPPQESR